MAHAILLSCLVLLTGGIGYAVFMNGGGPLVPWNECLLAVGLATIFYWPGRLSARDSQSRLDLWLALTVFLLIGYAAFQLLPLPLWLLKILSPSAAQAVENLGAVMRQPEFAPISVLPAATARYFLRIVGYALVFLTIRDISSRSSGSARLHLLFLPLIGIAGFEACWALLQPIAGVPAAGTYVNRNHFAGLLEMVLPLTVAYAFASAEWGDRSEGPDHRILKACGIGFVALLMFSALVTSLSKTGFVACVGALILMAAIGLRQVVQGWKMLGTVAGVIGLCLCIFVLLAPDELKGAFAHSVSDNTLEGRWPVWKNTVQLIGDFPLFGCGLGAYQNAFLKYQTTGVELSFDYAHNDYLQSVAEMGLAGFVILACFALQILAGTVRSLLGSSDRNTRYLALGCLGSFAAIGLHSLTDFNLYIPANAMVLAWVAGASSGLAASSPASSLARKGLSPVFLRCSAIAFGLLLSSYAAAWIVFQSGYQGDLRAEQAFCRFGICAVDSAMDEASASAEKTPDARRAQFLESLRRDPVNPLRWSDLGTEFSKSGDTVQAERCFVNALALGPEVPPVLLDAGEFYHKMRQDPRSLQLRALILAKTSFYDAFIFQSYTSNEFKLKEILQYGLPAGKRTAQAFFDYAITAPDYTANTMKLWDWLVSQGYSDDRRLKAYVTLLMNKQRYEDAAQVWSLHLGTQRNGYRQSTWIFDGDFELEGSDSPFDWDIRSVEGLRVTRDKSVAHSGAKSLRIEFEGKGNVSYADTSQIVVLPPGAYRFRAYVQTQEITTDQGIGFRFSNPDGHAAAIFTEVLTGTNGWRKVEQRLCITPQMRRTDVRIVRRRSNIFFRISGTAWVDSVELARIAETCSAAP